MFLFDIFLSAAYGCDTLKFMVVYFATYIQDNRSCKSKLLCLLLTFFLLNMLSVCFQIGFSYILFFS